MGKRKSMSDYFDRWRGGEELEFTKRGRNCGQEITQEEEKCEQEGDSFWIEFYNF